ncbi:OLC1v1016692C1 [Oldenlandia corymbosa var. corymbosa]|uniref:OLC1v1016692C1 n=1 Tax=Oldenlandia corymbosa var. corymbosa TaxID=529605 RepID=A0AAV1E7Q3_OLDCO|nr:OLC1v1016692C1 [Oldenlandia corymbosa var. corymbosa]
MNDAAKVPFKAKEKQKMQPTTDQTNWKEKPKVYVKREAPQKLDSNATSSGLSTKEKLETPTDIADQSPLVLSFGKRRVSKEQLATILENNKEEGRSESWDVDLSARFAVLEELRDENEDTEQSLENIITEDNVEVDPATELVESEDETESEVDETITEGVSVWLSQKFADGARAKHATAIIRTLTHGEYKNARMVVSDEEGHNKGKPGRPKEPMLQDSKIEDLKNTWRFKDAYVSVTGKIWVLCSSEWSTKVIGGSEQVLHLEVENHKIGKTVLVSVVYAKSLCQERQCLWSELHNFHDKYDGLLWMVGGDFNVIRNMDEYERASQPDGQWKTSIYGLLAAV